MGREIDKTAKFGHIVFPWLYMEVLGVWQVPYHINVLAKGDLIGHFRKMTNDHVTCM